MNLAKQGPFQFSFFKVDSQNSKYIWSTFFLVLLAGFHSVSAISWILNRHFLFCQHLNLRMRIRMRLKMRMMTTKTMMTTTMTTTMTMTTKTTKKRPFFGAIICTSQENSGLPYNLFLQNTV